MARGINKVILIGNLGQDPEVRFTPSGTAVANLNLATSDTWMDRQSGQRQERTEWHRVVLFNKTAEIAQQYLKKGSKVYIEGRLQTRKWQDQNGQDRYSTEIVANDMQMLDGRSGDYQGAVRRRVAMPSKRQPSLRRRNSITSSRLSRHLSRVATLRNSMSRLSVAARRLSSSRLRISKTAATALRIPVTSTILTTKFRSDRHAVLGVAATLPG